jgi:hypothetical protein
VSVHLDCTGALREVATGGTMEVPRMSYTSKTVHKGREKDLRVAAGDRGNGG